LCTLWVRVWLVLVVCSSDCGASSYMFICFFNDTATTEIYTLSLHDALPIWDRMSFTGGRSVVVAGVVPDSVGRSEEHTSELQSHLNLVCRLLLEKKKKA